MSEQHAPHVGAIQDGAIQNGATPQDGAVQDGATPHQDSDRDAAAVTPADPVRREIEQVDAAMAAVRRGVPAAGGEPQVPGEDEVAGLETAHEALRTTLDRVERRG